MTEQQPYVVVQRHPDFEVRDYPASTVAEVSLDASFEDAGTRAFRSLFGYISGGNLGRQSIAMTTPVLQHSTTDGRQCVGFVLPSGMATTDAPTPDDDGVRLRTVAGTRTAAVTYSGRWTRSSFDRHCTELLAALRREGLTTAGEPRFARYNPPFTPWFLRRNEVLVDLLTDGPAAN